MTPPASNVVVPPTNAPSDDASDDETTGTESKPETDDTSDDGEKEPVQKPESDPAAEDGSDNKETDPEADTVKEQILAAHEAGINVKGKVSGKLSAVQIEPRIQISIRNMFLRIRLRARSFLEYMTSHWTAHQKERLSLHLR